MARRGASAPGPTSLMLRARCWRVVVEARAARAGGWRYTAADDAAARPRPARRVSAVMDRRRGPGAYPWPQ